MGHQARRNCVPLLLRRGRPRPNHRAGHVEEDLTKRIPFIKRTFFILLALCTSLAALAQEDAKTLESFCEKQLPICLEAWNAAARDVLTDPEGVKMEAGETFLLKDVQGQRELADAFGFKAKIVSYVNSGTQLGVNPGPSFVSRSGNEILFFQFYPWENPENGLGILIFNRPERGEMLLIEGYFSKEFREKVAAWYPKMTRLETPESAPSAEEMEPPTVAPPETPEPSCDWNSFLRQSLQESGNVKIGFVSTGVPSLNMEISLPASHPVRERLAACGDLRLEELESPTDPAQFQCLQYLMCSDSRRFFYIFVPDGLAMAATQDRIEYYKVQCDSEFQRIFYVELRTMLEERLNTKW